MFASYTQQPNQTNFSHNPNQPPLRPSDTSQLPPTGIIGDSLVSSAAGSHGFPSTQVIPAKVKTLTKLERLLQQKDIFETLRKINSG